MKQAVKQATKKEVSGVIIHVVLSFLAVYAFNIYLFGETPTDFTNGLLSTLMFIAFLALGYKNPGADADTDKNPSADTGAAGTPKTHRTTTNIALCAAIFTAVVFGIGTSMYHTNSLEPIIGSFGALVRGLLLTAGAAYVLFLLFRLVFCWFKNFNLLLPKKNEWKFFGGNWQSLLLCWAVIFLAYVPALLAYYPGIFSYDANQTLWRVEDLSRLDNLLPVLHTFFTWIAYTIGGSNQAGTTVYAIMQMTVKSLMFSYVIYYFAKLNVHYIVRIIALAWFALSPFHAIFSIIQNQDALLAPVHVVLLVVLVDFAFNTEEFFASKPKLVRLIGFMLLFAMLRSNAIYALVIAAVIIPFILLNYVQVENRKKLFILFLGTAAAAWVISSPLETALGLDAGRPGEALSVPAQQIALAATRHWDDFDEWEQATANQVFPLNIAESYNPRLSDPIKIVIWPQNVGYLWQLWFRLLPQYPLEFTEAFITLNLPLWFPDAAYPDRYSQRRYIEDWIYYGFEIQRDSRLPWLYERYSAFAANNSILQRLPVLRTITSIGTPIWVIFAVGLLAAVKKKGYYIVPLIIPFALWATFIFGPVSNVRYMYPLIAGYPVYLAILALAAAAATAKEKNNG